MNAEFRNINDVTLQGSIKQDSIKQDSIKQSSIKQDNKENAYANLQQTKFPFSLWY